MAFLKIDKDLVDRWLMTDGEKLLWWIDLLQMAAWGDCNVTLFQGKQVRLDRGQLVVSLSFLRTRWNCGRKKVENFLGQLEEEGRIGREVTDGVTILTLTEGARWGARQGASQNLNETGTCVDEGARQGASRGATNNKIIDNNNISSLRDDATAPACAREGDSDSVRKSWDGLRDFFNRTMDERGARIPKIKAVTDRRLTAVMARAREYGGDAVYEVITKAATSPFLNGGGNHVFVADFDWIFRPNNFPKVLEGNYDERFTNNKNATRYDADNWTSGEAGGQGSDSGYEQRRNEAGALVARLLGEG